MENTAARGWTDTVSFELAMFERVGDDVVVTVRGMAEAAVELAVFDDGDKATITPVAPCLGGSLRDYGVSTTVDVVPGKKLVVRGLRCSETITAEDLVEGYPVVCSADPTVGGLPERFLHRRGERYVLMGGDAPAPSRSSGRTTLVA